MAKHKFTNGELAHAFFHQEEFGIDYGNASSFSFQKNRIFSYSSCIGAADFNRKIFLFRNGSYSNSTSKHQSNIRYAIPHDWKVYYWNTWRIDDFSYYGYRGGDFGFDNGTYNAYFQEAYNRLIEEKNKLFSGTKYFGYDVYDSIIKDLQEFSDTLNCKHLYDEWLPKLQDYKWTQEMIEQHKVKTWAYENGIKGSYETKLKVFENPDLATEIIEKNRIKKEKLETTKEERRLKAVQKSIDKWYAGETNEIDFKLPKRNWYNYSKIPIYFRISTSDPKMVQTSKNVTIPLVECALLYRKFKQCVETNTEWKQNGEKFRIGHYQVEKIYNDNGYKLLDGCHLCHQEQIEEFIDKFVPEWKL